MALSKIPVMAGVVIGYGRKFSGVNREVRWVKLRLLFLSTNAWVFKRVRLWSMVF